MNVLLEPFDYLYMTNAMWVSALVGGVCAFLSAYLMLKGWSLIGDALSHSIVPGVAGAYMLGLPFALGAFIAIAFVFYITVTTGSTGMAWGMSKLVGGICFSLGLILCVLLGAELFTSTTLTLVAKAANRITWAQLLKNWALVYFGNFIGGLIVVGLIIVSAEYMAADLPVLLQLLYRKMKWRIM